MNSQFRYVGITIATYTAMAWRANASIEPTAAAKDLWAATLREKAIQCDAPIGIAEPVRSSSS
jgi:hypothetical protein